jgi:hypothetical protein
VAASMRVGLMSSARMEPDTSSTRIIVDVRSSVGSFICGRASASETSAIATR